jgi:hypothetical protein
MFRMAVGHSDDVDLDVALADVFARCDDGLRGAAPQAGLLFSAWATDHQAVVGAIRQRYPEVELIGSTAAGEMSSTLGFQEDSIALALFASDQVDVVAGLGTRLSEDPRAAARQAVEEARAKSGREPRLCIAMTAIAGADPGIALSHLRDALGPGVPILGGGAAARDRRARTSASFQFAGDTVTDDGIVVLLFCGALSYSFGVDAGWRPVGPRGTVTRISPTGIDEIDGRPALEFYEHYLGPGEPAVANPLAVYEPDSDDFYLRAPVDYDRETGAVGLFGGVPDGAGVQLSMAATDDIFAGARSALARALDAFPRGSRPEAGLVFSCVIRKFILGTRTGRELEMAREMLGFDLPMAGLYCYGEIAPVGSADGSRFHNETLVAVLLGSG